MPSFFKRKAARALALLALLLPFQVIKAPSVDGSEKQTAEPEVEKGQIFDDDQYREYAKYVVNLTERQPELGIRLDGVKNKLLASNQTNEAIKYVLWEDPSMVEISRLFQPILDEPELKKNLENYPILVGEDVDQYLETIRKGSWGTTVMTVNTKGEVSFDSISFRTFLVAPDYGGNVENLKKLVREEFFQANQYDAVAANLYNSGYLTLVADMRSPERLAKELSVGNLRAFLELFPQQKYLTDKGFGSNSYNFYVGSELFEGPPASKATVDAAYGRMERFIEDELGIAVESELFVDAKRIEGVNDAFRQKYLNYYRELGFDDSEIQIWNLVGMKRENLTEPSNSLNMPALLDLPKQP